MEHKIKVTVNREPYEVYVKSNLTLVELLRDKLELTGTKKGCDTGSCGACAVIMDGHPINSCLVLAVEADGKEILTVEGLAQNDRLDPIQEAFVKEGAVQCGFCTPGMLISAKALLEKNPNPTDEQIKFAMAGHLCRCTGYVKIVKAVSAAAKTTTRRS